MAEVTDISIQYTVLNIPWCGIVYSSMPNARSLALDVDSEEELVQGNVRNANNNGTSSYVGVNGLARLAQLDDSKKFTLVL